ncbi:MAG: hypothetical protein PVG14_17455 [Anaerolineales bacterium]|jgi:hypothetical protein
MGDVNPNHYYEIRIDGHLDEDRTKEFQGLRVTPLPTGETLIFGRVIDQAALFGILIRIRDMGIRLISLTQHEEEKSDAKTREVKE